MPSRTKLKMEIWSLKGCIVQLTGERDRLTGAERVYQQELKKKDQQYEALMTQWQKFQKEYDRLSVSWNAFQGMVHRPTQEDMARAQARGEMIQAVAQMLVRAIFPDGAPGVRR